MSKLKGILDSLGINEKFQKRIQKDKSFNTIQDNVPHVSNSNMMCDLLHLPTAKFGFKYLFVICDLSGNGHFDIEPMKTTTSEESLKAMQKCFTRQYVKEPKYSLKTDGGSEWKGIFNKYLYEKNILHKGVVADRHQSMSMVESLNKQLGRLFNGYMNKKEEETGKSFKNWTDAVGTIREQLNEYRDKKLTNDPYSFHYAVPQNTREIEVDKVIKDEHGKNTTITETKNVFIEPKYKVGDMVYRALEAPKNALGQNQATKNFRAGDYTFDKTARAITHIFTMGGNGPLYRYYLTGIPNASYTERQLMKAPNHV